MINCRWLCAILFFFLMVGCGAISNADSSDPYLRKGIRLDIVGVNYVNRNVTSFWVDGNWGGNVGAARDAHSNGGNASTCCFNLVDYRKPIKIKWRLGGENSEPVMGSDGNYLPQKLLIAPVDKEAVVMLPQRLPQVIKTSSGIPETARQDTLCVIFKDMDTVKLEYGYVGCDEYRY
ncbi:hypothetical protein [Chromobacterium amazonense]|uniref:hypothetical protein n=1 Tax=Chromobacterium amazonense TaxID=1382803 RepID=UPI0031F60B15